MVTFIEIIFILTSIFSKIDEKIDESIKRVTGNELTISNKEVFSRSLMWGALSIFLADKKFTKKEQEIFKKNFGEKSVVSMVSLIKISNPKVIENKIQNAFDEASKLLLDDRKRLYSELEKLLKVAEGDKKLLNLAMNKIKGYLKI